MVHARYKYVYLKCDFFKYYISFLQLKPGILMNVVGIFVISLAVNTWGTALFHLDTVPPWAERNITAYNVTTL